MTIKELADLFPGRNASMINSKISRLKAAGKITELRKKEVVKRSLYQRKG